MVLHIAKPKPVPLALVVNNGSNIFGIIDFGIPDPVSSISSFIESLSSLNRSSILPSFSIA